MILSADLTLEKKFPRLLLSTEKLLEDKSIEDWKLQQVKKNEYLQYLFFNI
jgi:hypothetical protein